MKLQSKEHKDRIGTLKVFSVSPSNEGGELAVECVGTTYYYDSLGKVYAEWRDAPEMHRNVLPEPIRRMVQAWVNAQENPIKEIAILNPYKDRDQDGFYNYYFYGYVSTSGNKNLKSVDLEVRVKDAFEFEEHRDYLLEELGIEP